MEGKCWGTHHYLAGDDVLARLKEEGLRGVCCALLDFYNHRFETTRLLGDLDVPDWTVQEDPHGFEAMRESP